MNWLRWLVPLFAILLLFRLAKSTGNVMEDGSPASERRFAFERRQARKGRRTVRVLRTALGNVVRGEWSLLSTTRCCPCVACVSASPAPCGGRC